MVSLGFLPRMEKLRLSSAVFSTKSILQKGLSAMLNIAPVPGGIKRGPRPTFVVAGEGSQGEGESKHPLPVRVFGDFLRVEKVTLRSIPQLDTAQALSEKAFYFIILFSFSMHSGHTYLPPKETMCLTLPQNTQAS